jgi:hypothetical protein
MRSYTITRADNGLDETRTPRLSINTPYLQTPPNVHAYAQIGYTADALLLHLWIDVPKVRAEETGPIGMPCKDSCLEFFFQPEPDDPRYINVEFNSNGCLYLGMGTCIQDLIRLLPEANICSIFDPRIQKLEHGWEIHYQIPYSLIRRLFPKFTATPGKTIRANCYACSDLSQPHYYLSWNPITEEPFTFHHSSCFGSMTFA